MPAGRPAPCAALRRAHSSPRLAAGGKEIGKLCAPGSAGWTKLDGTQQQRDAFGRTMQLRKLVEEIRVVRIEIRGRLERRPATHRFPMSDRKIGVVDQPFLGLRRTRRAAGRVGYRALERVQGRWYVAAGFL